jgi:hypothetical protein
MLVWLDDCLHRVKCQAHKAGRRRTFRALYRLALPICHRARPTDHAR